MGRTAVSPSLAWWSRPIGRAGSLSAVGAGDASVRRFGVMPWGAARRAVHTARSRTDRGSALRLQIEERDARRVAHRGVVAGEREPAGLAVHLEDGDVVRPLVAAVQE